MWTYIVLRQVSAAEEGVHSSGAQKTGCQSRWGYAAAAVALHGQHLASQVSLLMNVRVPWGEHHSFMMQKTCNGEGAWGTINRRKASI